MSKLTLERLEYALAPHLIPLPEPAHYESVGDKPGYWRSGFVTALTENVCNKEALTSRMSIANIPQSLKNIPWC